MPEFFPQAEEIFAGIANAADREFSYSSSVKTGKLNRKQYIIYKIFGFNIDSEKTVAYVVTLA